MKILFCINGLGAGGKERRMLELIKGIKMRSDIQFELVIMNADIHYKEILGLGIRINYIIRKYKKDVSPFRKFYSLCKSYRPDIVNCWDSMTAVYCSPVCKLLHIKFVNSMVVDAPSKQNIFNKNWLRARLTFPFSNIVVGNSLAGLEAYKAPKSKSLCIYNGFNNERIKGISDKTLVREQLGIKTMFVVGMVASFSKLKDYDTYFRAAQMILKNRNDITFLAIGNNTDSISAKQLIEEDFTTHFRLLGRKTGIESFINIMDICVLSTFTEGVSNAILEYMALGKPVVATSGGGTCEIVEDQVTGFLVVRSSPDDLKNKIETLLNDSALRDKMGLAGKKRVQNFFSIDKMADKYVSLYETLQLKQL